MGSEIVQPKSDLRAIVKPAVPKLGSADTSGISMRQSAPKFGFQSEHHLQLTFFLNLFTLARWNPTPSSFLLSLSCPHTRTSSSLSWGSRR